MNLPWLWNATAALILRGRWVARFKQLAVCAEVTPMLCFPFRAQGCASERTTKRFSRAAVAPFCNARAVKKAAVRSLQAR